MSRGARSLQGPARRANARVPCPSPRPCSPPAAPAAPLQPLHPPCRPHRESPLRRSRKTLPATSHAPRLPARSPAWPPVGARSGVSRALRRKRGEGRGHRSDAASCSPCAALPHPIFSTPPLPLAREPPPRGHGRQEEGPLAAQQREGLVVLGAWLARRGQPRRGAPDAATATATATAPQRRGQAVRCLAVRQGLAVQLAQPQLGALCRCGWGGGGMRAEPGGGDTTQPGRSRRSSLSPRRPHPGWSDSRPRPAPRRPPRRPRG
jgi:hypothetical protein